MDPRLDRAAAVAKGACERVDAERERIVAPDGEQEARVASEHPPMKLIRWQVLLANRLPARLAELGEGVQPALRRVCKDAHVRVPKVRLRMVQLRIAVFARHFLSRGPVRALVAHLDEAVERLHVEAVEGAMGATHHIASATHLIEDHILGRIGRKRRELGRVVLGAQRDRLLVQRAHLHRLVARPVKGVLEPVPVHEGAATEHLMDRGDGGRGAARLRVDHRREAAQLELVDGHLARQLRVLVVLRGLRTLEIGRGNLAQAWFRGVIRGVAQVIAAQ